MYVSIIIPTKNEEKYLPFLLESISEHRLNSEEGEIKEKNYIRINNTNLSPEAVSKIIKEKFNF